MPTASADEMKALAGFVRQVRAIAGLREKSPAVFTLNGQPFVQFQSGPDGVVAELRAGSHKAGGFERFPIATPTEQRKFLDEARRRVDKFSED